MLRALAIENSVRKVTIEGRAKSAFDWYRLRASELDNEMLENSGKLPKHELWRRQYYEYPYLLLESNEAILERFADIFTNCLDISVEGKITPTPMLENDARLAQYFTEVIEETNWRGILNKGSMQPAFVQLNEYFKDGIPLGVEMFKELPLKQEQYLYKFSKAGFVREMLERGKFRISPASYYSKGSHIKAVKDLETERNYRLKAINEVMQGILSIEVEGNTLEIVNGVVPLCVVMEDYFLFSTCNELSRRMPTDFEADAVLIIKDKREFLGRLENELLISYPGWEVLERDVYYYDTYNDHPRDQNQEFYKHISYAYQREHRCILRPKRTGTHKDELKPFFVELGSIEDIAEALYI